MERRNHIRRVVSLLIAICVMFLLIPSAFASDADSRLWEKIISGLDESEYGYIFSLAEPVDEGLRRFGLSDAVTEIEQVEFADNTYTAKSLDDIRSFTNADGIISIEPNYPMYLYETRDGFSATEPNDAYFKDGSQWSLDMMKVPALWEYGLEGQNTDGADDIVVAVIDSGIKYSHEDFNWDNIMLNKAYSWVTTDKSNVNDTMGHGTFVSGIIAAVKDNEVGIAGIAQEIKIIPLRVFASQTASTSDVISAIYYATDNGADVINMSLGSEYHSSTLEEACDYARGKGVIVIAAAGNDGEDGNNIDSYPAQYNSVIGVGSIDRYGVRSSFSQYGMERVFVTAPGEEVVSTYYTNTSSYRQSSGTSFSSPAVAALAAIAKSLDNSIEQADFEERLIQTSTDKGTSGRDDLYGYGLVNFESVAEQLLDPAEETVVSFEFYNEASEKMEQPENMDLYVYASDSDGNKLGEAIPPEPDGTFRLATGNAQGGQFSAARYYYELIGDDATRKYENASGVFAAVTASRTIMLSLESREYYASVTVVDTNGDEVSDGSVMISRVSNGVVIQKISSGDNAGKYGVKTGHNKYYVTSSSVSPRYFPSEGSFTVNDADTDINVVMRSDNDVASVSFEQIDSVGNAVTDPGTAVRVYDGDKTQQSKYTDGYYKLAPGEYSYEADSNSYYRETGTFVIDESEKGNNRLISISMMQPNFWVFFEAPLDATIAVYDASGEPMIFRNRGEYKLPAGEYTYKVSRSGYKTVKGFLTVTPTSGSQGVISVRITMEQGTDPSEDCELLTVIAPDGVSVEGSTITKSVKNNISSIPVDISVSEGAVWELYSDSSCTRKIVGAMNLSVGENTAYIKVTAEDKFTYKVYKIIITREAGGGGIIGGGDLLPEHDDEPSDEPDTSPVIALPVETTTAAFASQQDAERAAAVESMAEKKADSAGVVIEAAGEAISISTTGDTITVLKIEPPQGMDVSDITTMAILNSDGTLTPIPTRIDENGNIIVLVTGDVTLVPIRASADFNDTENHWGRDEIALAAQLMIVEGIGGGKFNPTGVVTNAQSVTMFLRALGIAPDENAAEIDGIIQDTWYSLNMNTAVSYGLIEDTVDPDAPMTRIEIAGVIVNALNHLGIEPTVDGAEIDGILAEFSDLSGLNETERTQLAICVKLGDFQGQW